MSVEPVYIPIFRSRQQENSVLSSFNFHSRMFPLVEILKPFIRKRKTPLRFDEVYLKLFRQISASKFFVDLPVHLREHTSMQPEVIKFIREVINNRQKRAEFLGSLYPMNSKIIPVVSSLKFKGDDNESIAYQTNYLRSKYRSLAFRTTATNFFQDWDDILSEVTSEDYVILDLESVPPHLTPTLSTIVSVWKELNVCPKIVVRSAVNQEITNSGLDHNSVVQTIDNSILNTFDSKFHSDAFGDYVGIKKDDVSKGGGISPGFLFYNGISNEYTGFTSKLKKLSEMEDTIVPAILASDAAVNMAASQLPFLTNNPGWQKVLGISSGEESGQSQAKFKRIAMEHYLHCISVRIEAGHFD